MPVVDIAAQNFFPISKYLCTECCGNNPLYITPTLKRTQNFQPKKLNLILNRPTDKDGGRVVDITWTHSVV